jgi:Cof subfamily protein (haloacid dehalogenase superfamily)
MNERRGFERPARPRAVVVVTSNMDIRLLLSDVDGTLVTHDKVLTPAAIQAARDLRGAGVGLSLTSARPPQGLRMLVEPLDLQLPLAAFNGGLIVNPDLAVLESHPIESAPARAAVAAMAEGGLDLWIYTEDAWFVRDAAGPRVAREAWITKLEPRVVAGFGPEGLDRAFKIVGVSDAPQTVAAALARLRDLLGPSASVTSSEPRFVDVTHPLATKGAVVRTLARRLGLSPAEVATIGDASNDVLMFRESGLSIAMGQAGEAVKAEAGAVTDSNENDGFAKAVQRFILHRDPGFTTNLDDERMGGPP